MAEVKVAILGLERLGASVGLALKRYMGGKEARHTFTITGHDERGFNGKHARQIGAVDSVARGAADAVTGAHIVILAGGYHRAEALYQAIGPGLAPGAVVMDASPLKGPSIRWAADNLPTAPETSAYMVGFTAVLNPAVLYEANSEVEAARADLFDNGAFILTPAPSCPPEAVDLAAELARILGAEVHFMDPDEHDGLAGATEGVPAALAVALFQTFLRAQGWDDMRRLTNPAFGRLTSALRFQHPDALWALLYHNRAHTVRHLEALIDTLIELRDSLATDEDGLAVEAVIEQAASQYEKWESSRHANRWHEQEAGTAPDTSFISNMGGMLLGRRGRKKEEQD